MKSAAVPPMTLGNAAAAKVRLIVWCRDCGHQVEPDPAEQAQRYGADMPVLDWVVTQFEFGGRSRDTVVCSACTATATIRPVNKTPNTPIKMAKNRVRGWRGTKSP